VRPHAQPRLPVLAAVALLGTLASIGVAAAVVLIDPLWSTLFPGAKALTEDSIGASEKAQPFVRDALAGLARLLDGTVADVEPSRLGMLGAAAVVLVLLAIVSGAAEWGHVMLSRWVAFRIVIDLRVRIVRHLMSLSMRYHGRRSFGDVISRVGQDVQNTLFALDVALKDLVQQPAQALAFLVVAIANAPSGLNWAVVPVLVIVALPVAILGKRVRKRSKTSLTELGATVQVLSQMFIGVRTVKAFRAEQREIEAYERQNERYLSSSMRMVRAIASTKGFTAFFSLAGFALILMALGFALDGLEQDDMASLAIFVVALSQFYTQMRRVTNTLTRVQESMGASQRLEEILAEVPDLVERPGAAQKVDLGGGVRIDDVTFFYAAEEAPALSNVSLELRVGETLALVGPSGAGKSTLMDLVARFVDPSSGRIMVGGVDLRDVSLDAWTRSYAMVDQAPFLFHTTIRENLRYAKPDATDAQIEAAARAAHIHDFVLSLPQGYDTDVEDGGARLSGGQRQRLAIARALLKGAPLLLLDEATSALDSLSERAVQEALEKLMAGRTSLVIAHRLSTIRNATRIAVLEAGRVVELGSHAELLAKGGAYARLHALQNSHV
jgi:subfamily B ATP-binding cassette protein MsbA